MAIDLVGRIAHILVSMQRVCVGLLKRRTKMLDKQKLLEWLDKQTKNPQITKDMAIILGVLYGLIETGVFDRNQQWREEVHTNDSN